MTHTLSKAGKMTQKYWTSNVRELKQNSSKEPVIFNMCWGLNNCSISYRTISWEHFLLCVVRKKSSCSISTFHQLLYFTDSMVQYCMFWVCSSSTLTLLSERDSSCTQANIKNMNVIKVKHPLWSLMMSHDTTWQQLVITCVLVQNYKKAILWVVAYQMGLYFKLW